MKKLIATILVALSVLTGAMGMTACGGEKTILVVTRESGSGTRDAFDSKIKNEAGDSLSKKADGTSFDAIVKTANLQNSTGNVRTKVASVKSAIGYISLGSLDDSVKSVKYEGISATSENVLNGTYALQRPFIIMTNKETPLSVAAADFMKYLTSKEAQLIVKKKCVEQASALTYVAPTAAITGSVVIKGSTSVEEVMKSLIADYKKVGGENVKGVEFSMDCQGSAFGITAAKTDKTGTVIGLNSSAIKASDAPSLNSYTIALDAVAVIVNKSNAIENFTRLQLYKIYTGEITKFSKI